MKKHPFIGTPQFEQANPPPPAVPPIDTRDVSCGEKYVSGNGAQAVTTQKAKHRIHYPPKRVPNV